MAAKRHLTQADINLLKKIFATKKDLSGFATKEDLSRFATKDDFNSFATKKDLYDALDAQELKFEAKLTKFRDDFYTRIDPILKEVIASREDRIIGVEQHRRNEEMIEKLEKIHPHGRHSSVI